MPPLPSGPSILAALADLRADCARLWSPGAALSQRMLDQHRGLIGLSLLLLGPFAAALWAWDWANDPVGAAHTVGLRLSFLLLMPTGLFALTVKRPWVMGLLLQATTVWTLIVFSLVLARLHGGMLYGVSAYVTYYIFGLFILGGLPLVWSLCFALLMPTLPHGLALVGFLPGFPHLSFALLMWPMSACMLSLYLVGARGELRRLDLEQQLEAASNADPLTGVSNLRHFMPRLEAQIDAAHAGRAPLSVIMLDVDHFKRINDSYGHAAGDEAIRQVAQLCRDGVRSVDLVARLGGEEFALLLPGLGLAEALGVAERVRAGVGAWRLELGAEVTRVTISAGVAALRPAETASQLLARADAALYEAKGSGRDCVRAAATPVAAAAAQAQPPERARRSLFQ